MDSQTADYYRSNAPACVRRYESADVRELHDTLRALVQPGHCILDIGGGSGRDAAFLANLGCVVTYTDGCEEMFTAALEKHAILRERARAAEFPLDPGDPLLDDHFDIVLCLAVIMHLDGVELREVAAQITRVTSPAGAAVISHSLCDARLTGRRDRDRRLFHERRPAEVADIFTPHGFVSESEMVTCDGLGRGEIRWATQIFRRSRGVS